MNSTRAEPKAEPAAEPAGAAREGRRWGRKGKGGGVYTLPRPKKAEKGREELGKVERERGGWSLIEGRGADGIRGVLNASPAVARNLPCALWKSSSPAGIKVVVVGAASASLHGRVLRAVGGRGPLARWPCDSWPDMVTSAQCCNSFCIAWQYCPTVACAFTVLEVNSFSTKPRPASRPARLRVDKIHSCKLYQKSLNDLLKA